MKIIKRILSLAVAITVLLSLCSCATQKDNTNKDMFLIYNGCVYDNMYKGSSVSYYWDILSDPTLKDKGYFGNVDDESKKPDSRIERYSSKSLDMFVWSSDSLFCKKDYEYPDYMVNEVDKIILTAPDVDFKETDKSLVIDDEEEIDILMQEFRKASDRNNWEKSKDFIKEDFQNSDEVYIEFELNGFEARYIYGYIAVNNDGGTDGLFVQSAESEDGILWKLDDRCADILSKRTPEFDCWKNVRFLKSV